MWPFKKRKKVVLDPQTIPFSMNKGVPIIEVELNGKRARFLIDTGASSNILASGEKKKYGFKTYSNSKGVVSGIGGSEQMLSVGGTEVLINKVRVRMPFKSIDLSHVKNKLHIQGIIGSRWLDQQDYIIDYCTNTIYRK
jgi:predicted aspartyl protease